MRNVTRNVEPLPRTEPALRQQQRFVFKFGDLKQGSAGQPVRGRQRSDHMHRIEQSAFKARRASRRNAEMSFAAFESAEQPCAAILDQMHLDAGM
jgi:hypothetical protein